MGLMLVSQIAGSKGFSSPPGGCQSTLIAIALAWPICELASFLADANLKTFESGSEGHSLITLYLWNRFTTRKDAPI